MTGKDCYRLFAIRRGVRITVVLQLMLLFVCSLYSANAATINGISLPYPNNYSSNYGTISNGAVIADNLGSGCWRFAYLVYGDIFHRNMATDKNVASCVVTPYHQVIPTTTDNLKTYIRKSGPGAVIRVTSYTSYNASDNNGHSMVIIDSDENGAWIYQAGGNGTILSGNTIKYWTWSVMAQKCVNGGFSEHGQYIKYILCPEDYRTFGGGGMTPTPATNFRFKDVTYPKTFKIDTTYGWKLGSGIVESNYNLTSIRSQILNSSGGSVSDSGTKSISGYSYTIKTLDDYSGTNNGVRFSWIKSAGNYTWRLTATDSGGRTLVMDMPFKAVDNEETKTAVMSEEYPSTISVTGVTLDLNSVALWEGETTTVTSTVSPSNATNSAVTWTSSKPAIATVTPVSGNARQATIKAVKAGTATITCKTSDGGKTAICSVTVKKHATGIELSPTSLKIKVGETSALTATVLPSDATNKTVHWSSDNTSIATVNNGTVKGIAAGTATITAMAEDGGYTKKCTVTVVVPVNRITLNKSSLSLVEGNTSTLTATVFPSNATNKSLTWSSNKTSVAKISSSGIITAVGTGTATITCTAADGSGVKATCTVTVEELSLILPSALTEIGEEAFSGIDARRIVVPDGVKKIGKKAFADCPKLEQITIPASTTTIAKDAFVNAPSGFTIHGSLNSYAQTFASENGIRFVADDACTITFDADGGECSETSRIIKKGTAIGTLPTPTKRDYYFVEHYDDFDEMCYYHYTFDGWYTGGTKVSASSKFTESTTLYAYWEEDVYNED